MIRHRAIPVVSLVVLLWVIGCGQGLTAKGTLYNVNIARELVAYVPAKLEAVYAATEQAVKDMGYTVETSAIDVREGKVEGTTAVGKAVRVTLAKQGEDVTKVNVYVGGDEPASKELLDKIEYGCT